MYEQLKKRLDDRIEERKRSEDLDKKNSERMNDIKAAKDYRVMDFYCDECEADFINLGYKDVIDCYDELVAKYETKCPYCGTKSIRRITDTIDDPFYRKSRKVRNDREQAEIDMIQPGDPRFKTYYPEQYKKLEEQKARLYAKNE